MNHSHQQLLSRRGFTLIEMLVVVSIFALLTTVVMTNYHSIDNTLLLESEATNIAISVRQAQVSGTSVLEDVGTPGSFSSPYGVEFKMANPGSYSFFVDRNVNGVMDNGELIQTYTLGQKYTIAALCRNNKDPNPLNRKCNRKQIDVTFLRPNPEAIIETTDNAGNLETCGPKPCHYSDVEIVIQSPNGNTKTIVVWSTGQVSIE